MTREHPETFEPFAACEQAGDDLTLTMRAAAGPAEQHRAILQSLVQVRGHLREERGPIRGLQRYLARLESAIKELQVERGRR